MTDRNNLPVSTLRICIDEKRDGNKEGRAYCRLFPKCIHFKDLAELLLKADKMFDKAGVPQAYQQSSSFAKKKKGQTVYTPDIYFTEIQLQQKQGKISTEYIVVRSRCKSGWQGIYIDHVGRFFEFISEMELLKYMTGAMDIET